MPIPVLDDLVPTISPTAWVHPDAVVIGDVRLGDEVSVWPTSRRAWSRTAASWAASPGPARCCSARPARPRPLVGDEQDRWITDGVAVYRDSLRRFRDGMRLHDPERDAPRARATHG